MRKNLLFFLLAMFMPFLASADNMAINKTKNSSYSSWASNPSEHRLGIPCEAAGFTSPMSGSESYTIATWIRPTEVIANGAIMALNPQVHMNSNGNWSLNTGATGNLTIAGHGGSSDHGAGAAGITGSINAQLNLNEWNYVTVVVDNTNLKFAVYLDGELKSEKTMTEALYFPAALQNGGDGPAWFQIAGYGVSADIDEVHTFNAALSAEEVAQAYTSPAGIASLTGYFTFDEESATTGYFDNLAPNAPASSSAVNWNWNKTGYGWTSGDNTAASPTLIAGREIAAPVNKFTFNVPSASDFEGLSELFFMTPDYSQNFSGGGSYEIEEGTELMLNAYYTAGLIIAGVTVDGVDVDFTDNGGSFSARFNMNANLDKDSFKFTFKNEEKPVESGSVELNGVDQYIRIPHSSDFDIPAGGTMTISAKVYLEEGSNAGIFSNRHRTTTSPDDCSGVDIYFVGMANTLGWNVNVNAGGWQNINTNVSRTLAMNEWQTVTWVFDGSEGRCDIYLNGTHVGETASNKADAAKRYPINPQGDILFGARYNTNATPNSVDLTQLAKGKFSDIRIYRDALTDAEVTADMNGAVSGKTLIAAYNFAEVNGNQAADITGNGHTAELVGFEAPVQNYTLTIEQPENATITVKNGDNTLESGAQVAAGTELTLSAETTPMYQLVNYTLNGQPVEGNSFTMPEEEATISAVVSEVEYCTYSGTVTRTDRGISKITVNGTDINGPGSGYNHAVYADQTATVITAEPGDKLTITSTGKGSWMMTFIYGDFDLNGWNVDTKLTEPNGDLLWYNLTGEDGENQYDMEGNLHTGSDRECPINGINAEITLPENMAAGEYRMRYKVDWATSDPCGSSTMTTDGGVMIDFTLKIVVNPVITIEQPENAVITVMNGENAIASGDKVAPGTELTLSATCSNGFNLVNYTLDGEPIEGNTFEAPAENFTVSATVAEIDYCGYSGNTTYSGRGITSLDVNGTTIEGNGSSGSRPVYVDRTDNVVVVKPGETVNITSTGNGSWMHTFIYADFDLNGWNVDTEATTVNGDLVWYQQMCPKSLLKASGSSVNNEQFYDMEGNSMSESEYGIGGVSAEFTVPADLAPGDYRVRYKTDWASTEPCGSTAQSIATNGGSMIDFTIRVLGPRTISVAVAEGQENLGSVSIEGSEDLSITTADPEVTIKATPNSTLGAGFINWTRGGETISTEATYNATDTENAEYVANFGWVVNFIQPVGGKVEVFNGTTPVNSGDAVAPGTVLTIKTTADEGKELENIIANGLGLTATDGEAEYTVTGYTQINVLFMDAIGYTFSKNISGNGDIQCWTSFDYETFEPAGTQYSDGDALEIGSNMLVYIMPGLVQGEEYEQILALSITNGDDDEINLTNLEDASYPCPFNENYTLILLEVSGDINVTATFADKLSGIADIIFDGIEGETEYYNLNGVRINPENVENGVYILRRGNVSKKVYIRK